MSQLHYSYVEAISKAFPGVLCEAPGEGNVYEDIVWVGGNPMPTKQQLDDWITADVKIDMWELIKTERDRRKFGGVHVASVDKWFHSDDTSRIQQLGLVMMGAGLPSGIMWKTMDGTYTQMTQALAVEIFQTVAAKDIAIFAVAEQHRIAMLAATNPAEYNYLTGTPAWPTIFGE